MAAGQGLGDQRGRDVSLADHQEIGMLEGFRTGHDVRPADDHRFPLCLRHADDLERIDPLRQHPAGHHHVGPGEVGGIERLGVALMPCNWNIRLVNRDETERRCRAPHAVDVASRLQTSERVGIEAREDHENIRGRHGRSFAWCPEKHQQSSIE